MRRKFLITAIVASMLTLTMPASMADLELLGKQHFVCRKGALRLHGDKGTRLYPAGKREKVRLERAVGILSYTCAYIRSSVVCPMGTTFVDVKRGFATGRYDVECLRVPTEGIPGLDDTSAAAAGEEPGGPKSVDSGSEPEVGE